MSGAVEKYWFNVRIYKIEHVSCIWRQSYNFPNFVKVRKGHIIKHFYCFPEVRWPRVNSFPSGPPGLKTTQNKHKSWTPLYSCEIWHFQKHQSKCSCTDAWHVHGYNCISKAYWTDHFAFSKLYLSFAYFVDWKSLSTVPREGHSMTQMNKCLTTENNFRRKSFGWNN